MVMKNNVFVILVFINLLFLSFAGFIIAGCYHDILVLRRINESLQQCLADLQQDQNEIKKDMREVKTDSDIVLRLVVSGEYLREEK